MKAMVAIFTAMTMYAAARAEADCCQAGPPVSYAGRMVAVVPVGQTFAAPAPPDGPLSPPVIGVPAPRIPPATPAWQCPPAYRRVSNDAPTIIPGYAYRPAVAVVAMPPAYYVGRGIIGQPTVYVPRQPVRNFFRWLSP